MNADGRLSKARSDQKGRINGITDTNAPVRFPARSSHIDEHGMTIFAKAA